MQLHPTTTASTAVDTAVQPGPSRVTAPHPAIMLAGFSPTRWCAEAARRVHGQVLRIRDVESDPTVRSCTSGRRRGTRIVTSGTDSSLPDRATEADAADAPDAVHAVDTRNAAHAPRAVHTGQSAHAPLKADAENGQHAGQNSEASAGAGAPSDRNAAGCGRASSHSDTAGCGRASSHSDTAGRGRASDYADAAGRCHAPGHRDTVGRIHAARDSDTIGGPDAADRGDRAGSGRRTRGVLLALSARLPTGHGWWFRDRFQRPDIDWVGGALGRSCRCRCSAWPSTPPGRRLRWSCLRLVTRWTSPGGSSPATEPCGLTTTVSTGSSTRRPTTTRYRDSSSLPSCTGSAPGWVFSWASGSGTPRLVHVQPTDLLVGLDERAHPLLVGGEPGRRVPPGGGQLSGQQVGAQPGPGPVPPPDIGDELNAASPSNPTRPLDQRSITTWATWSR